MQTSTATTSLAQTVHVHWLGVKAYSSVWQAMKDFTQTRSSATLDEIWFVEHLPVFTQGQNGKAEHLLSSNHIPLIHTDRGGQITYHGPGQLMIYTLIDLKRKGVSIRQFVTQLEQTIIDLLADFQINGYGKCSAPGIYVKKMDLEKKIGSIGLRVRKNCTYHGIAFNVDMDLTPFTQINPCGFKGLEMTHFKAEGGLANTTETARYLVKYLVKNLGYTNAYWQT